MKDIDSSPAGTEFDARTGAGLPVRPPTLPLQPIQAESSESTVLRGESPRPSASSRLVEALSRPRAERMEVEDTEQAEARAPRKAISPE